MSKAHAPATPVWSASADGFLRSSIARAAGVLLSLSCLLPAVRADDTTRPIHWSARDTGGQAITVPAPDQPSILLFVRVDQPESIEAMKVATAAAEKLKPIQLIAVLSGPQEEGAAKKLAAAAQWSGRVVLDGEYEASGQMRVSAWPTTVVVDSAGQESAHVAGLSPKYAADLDAYLSSAAGKIDPSTLRQRLATHDVVAESPEQMAQSHLAAARRLLERNSMDLARAELAKGLSLQPHDARLQLAMAEVMLMQGQAAEAVKLLDQLDPAKASVPGLPLLRGRALIMLGQWDAAKTALLAAAKDSPASADLAYAMGLIYQHESEWRHAAECFRAACDAKPPTTQP